jgi:hypothetical protein
MMKHKFRLGQKVHHFNTNDCISMDKGTPMNGSIIGWDVKEKRLEELK